MEQYVTLSVRRIAITASTDDVQNFFATKIPGGDPVVNSLVSDTNCVFQNATVTFKGRTKVECNATIKRLQDTKHRTLVDGAGTTSILDFDVDFLGLTELANRCANDEKPYFEYLLLFSTCLVISNSPVCILSMAWVVMPTTPSATRRMTIREAICGLETYYQAA